ncbi:hypothetical protein [Ornithinibacillus halotolerans]|uniref:Uncharacterized protein n=1 Tax=Ornithinibacillus halotolerans TaxID=1274357 RepID=A0A916RQ67_9BACI|nr:hypothetical protein [Ornithinibacillus halotolerans]GGA64991.1 hypothetical protein GCM10008025_05980 [Ornithinibacillus halotolerans]
MDRWYSSFIVGAIVFIFITFTTQDLRQATLMGIGIFIAFFLIYLFLKKTKEKKRN